MPSASQTEVLLLHHDHHAKLAPADGFAPPPCRLTAGGSTIELRGNGKWSARSDLHAQGCLILNQVGLLFPVNHAPESWSSWRDSHPLVIRLERATARRLCAQEQLALGRDGRNRAGNLLDVTEPLCLLSYVPRWLPRMDSHHQHPASETGVLLIELQGNKMVEPRGVAPRTSTMRAWRSSA